MKAMIGWLCLILVALATPRICRAQTRSAPDPATLKVTSSAFSNRGKIPKKYTCDDSDVNPPLRIENLPKSVKSLALIVDDPDAPGRTWTHWLVWNIDPKVTTIREASVPPNAVQGTTDFGRARYGGPCPPPGTHRYYFKVYALDIAPSLPGPTTKAVLERAMAGHIVAQGSLMGTYSRGN